MNVGVRELKAKLSRYVARAAEGTRIIVTDRGRPVAELVPITGGSIDWPRGYRHIAVRLLFAVKRAKCAR